MNKITLDTFIQKYNLGGNVNSVKWESDGSTLSTRFISPDKSLLGQLTLKKQTLPEFEEDTSDKAKKLYMEHWTCSFCGKHTHGVDYDYLSGTDHLGCVLEQDKGDGENQLKFNFGDKNENR